MTELYEPYFKIYIGDSYIKLGHPILFVTSHKDFGGYCSEYFSFFSENEEKIFSKRIVSREEEINGLKIGSDMLFEEAFKAGKAELLNHLVNQYRDYSGVPVSLEEFELVEKEKSDFIQLSLFASSISETVRKIALKTKNNELQSLIARVLVMGNISFNEI